MQRGDFESTALSTNVATSAKQSEIEVGSLARGMSAFGEGLGAVSDLMGKFANMADKAFAAKQGKIANMDKAIDGLKNAEAANSLAQETWKNAPDSPEKTQALKVAADGVNSAKSEYARSVDDYSRTGVLFSQLGSASAESGFKRMEKAGIYNSSTGVITPKQVKNDKGEEVTESPLKTVKNTTFWDAFMTNGRGSHMK